MKIDIKLTEGSSGLLNIIRGVTAQLVVIGHILSRLGVKLNFFGKSTTSSFQHFGVLIFFVLSGFLIAYTIDIRGSTYTFKKYIFDRFVRIFSGFIPSLFFVVIVDAVLIYALRSYPSGFNYSFKAGIINVLMLQDFPFVNKLFNFNSDSCFGSGKPFWSIAVEWWLYIFYGFLVLKYFNSRKKYIYHLLPLLFSISPIYHLIGGRSVHNADNVSLFWFIGVAVFYLLPHTKKINFRVQIIVASIVFALLRFYIVGYAYDAIFGIFIAISFLFSLSLLQYKIVLRENRIFKLGEFFSAYSLTLYLIHYTILIFLEETVGNANKIQFILFALVLSNVIAFILAYFTEMRYKQLKNRLAKLYF